MGEEKEPATKTPGAEIRDLLYALYQAGASAGGEFTDKEIKEIELALVYQLDFAHGTTGHNQLMLIAKLFNLLKVVEGQWLTIR